jgi:hypothetical protein
MGAVPPQQTGTRGVPHSTPPHFGHGCRPVSCAFLFAMTRRSAGR